jgi:hypothetical protein
MAAPQMAAPHMAAPHMAAPHMAAPHMAAPAPHFAAPHMAVTPHAASSHFAAPHAAAAPHRFAVPHVAHGAPHFAPRHVAAPHIAPHHEFARGPSGHGGPHQGRLASGPSRHMSAAHATPQLNRHASSGAHPSRPSSVVRSNPNATETRAAQQHLVPRAGQAVGSTAHQNAAAGQTVGHGRATPEQSHLAQARRAPIIQNPVFASRTPRRAPTSLTQPTFRGQFAQSSWAEDWRRHHHHNHIFAVLGFVGPVFWPYAYNDFIDYTFDPYAYDTFWPYAFDDVYVGIYGGYAPEHYAPEEAYAYAGSPASERAYAASERTYARTGNAAPSGVGGNAENARICSGEAQGVTDFSIQKIAQQVNPDQQQQALLDDLKTASLDAVKALQAACPTELPTTPTGRIAAMRTRVDAMLKAVQTVRPALDKFYQSLNDEQRERFNALDQNEQTAAQPADVERVCKSQQAGSHGLPIDKIERSLKLNPDQEDGLKALDQATANAAQIMQAKCQAAQTLTPTGRLAAMEDRLSAMSDALRTTQVALTKFYGSLSDEQKARFDRLNVRRG